MADTHHVITKLVESDDDPGALSIHPTCLEFAEEGSSAGARRPKRLRRRESDRAKKVRPASIAFHANENFTLQLVLQLSAHALCRTGDSGPLQHGKEHDRLLKAAMTILAAEEA